MPGTVRNSACIRLKVLEDILHDQELRLYVEFQVLSHVLDAERLPDSLGMLVVGVLEVFSVDIAVYIHVSHESI